MPTRSEPFFFCDFDEGLHKTMVFGLAEPDKPNDLYVRLEKKFIVKVPVSQIQTGAARRVQGSNTRKRPVMRQVELNAVRLKDGEFASIAERELVYAVNGVDEVENFGEAEGCDSCDGECTGNCHENTEGGSIATVKIGVDIE